MEFNEFDEIADLGHLIGENDFLEETENQGTENDFLEDNPSSQTQDENGGGFAMNLSYIDPNLAVNLIDTILVAGAVYAFSLFKKRITKAQLKMSEAEKRNLEPIVKACLESVNFNVSNPWSALAMSVGFIYGSKIIMVYADGNTAEPVYTEDGEITIPAPKKRGRPRKHFS